MFKSSKLWIYGNPICIFNFHSLRPTCLLLRLKFINVQRKRFFKHVSKITLKISQKYYIVLTDVGNNHLRRQNIRKNLILYSASILFFNFVSWIKKNALTLKSFIGVFCTLLMKFQNCLSFLSKRFEVSA